MNILSVDTSCDETAVAVTNGTIILSNVVWSQASIHAKFGGVFPSLAKREHKNRIDWVIEKALKAAGLNIKDIDAVGVTVGPGLAVSLEVGIEKAKEISKNQKVPFIPVNHIEGHILSPLARPKLHSNFQLPISKHNSKIKFPAIGIVASGGHTQIILVKNFGQYKILATTVDDALGEALDKAARMLGLGYPGGPLLEKLAKSGSPEKYSLPTPLIGQEARMQFSYSGLKTAFYRLNQEVGKGKSITKKQTEDLAAVFQKTAFVHFIRVFGWMIENDKTYGAKNILAGGGVVANIELRKMLRTLAKKHFMNIHFPYTKKLYGDNAGMIGIAAGFKAEKGEFEKDINKVDRSPNAKIDKPFSW